MKTMGTGGGGSGGEGGVAVACAGDDDGRQRCPCWRGAGGDLPALCGGPLAVAVNGEVDPGHPTSREMREALGPEG